MNTYHPYYLITYPPPPHCVVLTPVPGGESGCSGIAGHCGYNFTATADCPPETGGRGAKRRWGWIKPLTTTYYLSTPSPLRGIVRTSYWGVRPSEGTDAHSVPPLKALFAPCLRGRKWMLGYLKHTKSPFSCCNYSPLLQRG